MSRSNAPGSGQTVQLIIFDWAGTTVDYGCCAPAAAFVEGFRKRGVTITMAEAREPMGMAKRDHIAAVMAIDRVAEAWRCRHGRASTSEDIDDLYQLFGPLLDDALQDHGTVIAGVVDTVASLRRRGLKIAASTGYYREAAEVVARAAAAQGYIPDASLSASDVPAGRPAPWMIFRLMERLAVFPPPAVVNVGDTIIDMHTASNAGVWAVGVARTGNLCGLSHDEFARLDDRVASALVDSARRQLTAAGAHYVIDSVAELEPVIDEIQARLARGGRPTATS